MGRSRTPSVSDPDAVVVGCVVASPSFVAVEGGSIINYLSTRVSSGGV
jgi:hypothetical protein